MMNFTHDEINLMTIYNTGSRAGLIEELTAMRGYLEDVEKKPSVLGKLKEQPEKPKKAKTSKKTKGQEL